MIDSQSWTCAGCGGRMVGDVCGQCLADRLRRAWVEGGRGGVVSEQTETPFQKFLREATENLVAGQERRQQAADQIKLSVRKLSAMLPVSQEMLMDVGAIPDTRPPPPPPTRRQRFRWWRSHQRERLAYWLFRQIAGYDVPEDVS